MVVAEPVFLPLEGVSTVTDPILDGEQLVVVIVMFSFIEAFNAAERVAFKGTSLAIVHFDVQ